MPKRTVKPLIERLLAKVEKQPDGGCWLWTGCVNGRGYGVISRGRNGAGFVHTHRAAWELFVGSVPDGLCVLHDCPGGDNPACCNPAHLWLGTHAQNSADMVAKGRSAKGEQVSAAKLTAVKVREIREQAARGVSQRAIGAMFGVHHVTVGMIVTGRSWKHVV